MSDWRPIESAPKDGTWILLYSVSREEAVTGLWQGAETLSESFRSLWPHLQGMWVEDLFISYDREREPYRPIREATHWMPLPPPPPTGG